MSAENPRILELREMRRLARLGEIAASRVAAGQHVKHNDVPMEYTE